MKFNKRTIPTGNLSPQRNAFKLAYHKNKTKKFTENVRISEAGLNRNLITKFSYAKRWRETIFISTIVFSLIIFNLRKIFPHQTHLFPICITITPAPYRISHALNPYFHFRFSLTRPRHYTIFI